jgi:hypothetical protein
MLVAAVAADYEMLHVNDPALLQLLFHQSAVL